MDERVCRGKHLATYNGANTYFALTDWLGSKRMELSVSAASMVAVGEQCTNLPFGDGQNCTGTEVNQLHFTDKERDTEAGNDYFGARYYASSTERFLSTDWASDPTALPYASYANPQSLNLYTYMRNNPLSGIDPDGHCCWNYIAGTIGGVLNIVPNTINLANDITNVAISPFTSYRFGHLDLIQADANASAAAIATGEALQRAAPIGDLSEGAQLHEQFGAC